MKLDLPPEIAEALEELFQTLPPEQAMRDLVDRGPASSELSRLVGRLVTQPAIADRPDLIAGLWLYVDELDRSHTISQAIESQTGSYWHGIMHRREGDFSNSHYWFRRTGDHPAMTSMPAGYDAHQFIDDVEQAHRQGKTPEPMVALQQQEWVTLFEWCAKQMSE